MKEIWITLKNKVDYGDNYSVSSIGRVKNTKSGRILKLETNKRGYLRLMLSKKGKTRKYFVHRLVAIAFIPNPDNKEQINHKDGVKNNNHVNNLEWVSKEENVKHASDNNLYKFFYGEMHGNTKLTKDDLTDIEYMISKGLTQKVISEKYNVSRGTISNIKRGIHWTNIK